MEIPKVDLNKQVLTSWLHKDKVAFLLSLNDQTNLSGQKPNIGWGAISEHIIASIMSKLGIFKRAKEEGQLKLFDPFLGSGTILLEGLFGCIDYPKQIDQVHPWHRGGWVTQGLELLLLRLADFGVRKHAGSPL